MNILNSYINKFCEQKGYIPYRYTSEGVSTILNEGNYNNIGVFIVRDSTLLHTNTYRYNCELVLYTITDPNQNLETYYEGGDAGQIEMLDNGLFNIGSDLYQFFCCNKILIENINVTPFYNTGNSNYSGVSISFNLPFFVVKK